MAPSWVFAILFILSAILGTGFASSIKFCGDYNESQCVEPKLCKPQSKVQLRMMHCPDQQICCRVEEINNLAAGELDEYA